MSDIRFSGVAVYPHVMRADDAPTATTDIDALADTLLALDGLQQCDLAAALVRRNPRAADALSTTIGDAVVAGLEPPLGMVIGGPPLSLDDTSVSPNERFAQNVLQRVADEDCRYQLAWTQ